MHAVSASKMAAAACSPAQARFPKRVRRTGPPQRTGRRCGSREAPASTGTSPAPSAPDEGPGDRKTNGSVPRPSRREAAPQRRLSAWLAALSRRAGVSRDQPQEASRVQRREVERSATSPGVGHGLRPLARAGTAQRGEWPTSSASSGGRGARGVPPGRGLALPGPAGEWAKKRCPNAQLAQRRSLRRAAALPVPCHERTRACPATGDAMEAVGVSPHLPVRLPLTRCRVKIGGRMGDTRPLTRGEKTDV